MKTIIAGTRIITEYAIVCAAVAASGFVITQVVSGVGEGVDRLGERWGYQHDLPIARFVADWKTHGIAAGPLRNGEMAAYADALILVWDGKSRGSADMLRKARARDLYISVYRADCVLCGVVHPKDQDCAGRPIDWAARKARAMTYHYKLRFDSTHEPPYEVL